VPDEAEAELLPLFLKLEGRDVLVVGAGEIAQRKIEALLQARARVRVVAPDATEGMTLLAQQGRVAWSQRGFEEADVDGAWLVVVATSDPQVQVRAAAEAEARHVFCLAVDDPANASAYSGAVVRRPPFAIAISSGGATPALTRLVREIVEQALPGDEWVEHARRLRDRWQKEGTPMADRFAQLLRELKART
jgi:siroheme synthase-like protein